MPLQYIRTAATAPAGGPSQPGGSPSVQSSSLFGIQIGPDTSNNFGYSAYGLAVSTPNGRFVGFERGRYDRLVDVTALLLPVNPLVYRIPVGPDDLEKGDLIVTADPPNFAAVYFLDWDRKDLWQFKGLDTGTSEFITFSLPDNPFANFFVRAYSLYDMLVC